MNTTKTSADLPGDGPDNGPADASAATPNNAQDKRKARTIDGTAHDVTDAPGPATPGRRSAGLTIALPILAFFVGAAALAAVLWQAGLLITTAAPSSPRADAVAARLDAADTRIAALLRDVERLAGQARSAEAARADLQAALAAVQNQVADAPAIATQGLARAQDLNAALRLITEIDGRLTDAETALGAARAAVQPEHIQALEQTLAELTPRVVAAEAAAAEADTAVKRVSAMEAGVTALGAVQTAHTTELAAVRSELAALSARADAAREALRAESEQLAALGLREDSLESRVQTLERKADQPEAARRAALGIALASLAGATNGGGPFATELDAVAQLAPGTPQTAALRDAAQTGVADKAALLTSFEPAARAALKADAAAQTDGIWDRLAGNAASLVTIRRTGALEGDSTEALLARGELALRQGDLNAALATLDRLDGPAADAMAAWMQTARARAAVDDLIRDMRQTLLADLAQAHRPPPALDGGASE